MDYFVVLKMILDYIENHIEDNFSINKISEISGFSLSHIRLIFRGAVGRSLSSYVRSRKLSHAAWDLGNTTNSIIQIAIKYGFGSHETFTRAFKREFSITPKSFREKKLSISRTLIVPGIFGPMVIKKEDLIKMDNIKKIRKGDGYKILDGVPYISYFKQEDIEITPYPSSLKSCLKYIGQNISYSKLMSASGASFRLIWNTQYWDGGNVGIMNIRKNPIEPL